MFNVLVQAIIVPTVALTPPPDQAEANWLLGVTYLSPSPFLSPIVASSCQWSTLGHPEAAQCQFVPSNSREPLTHLEPLFTISRHRASETAICMHSMSPVISYFSQKDVLLVTLLQLKSSSSLSLHTVVFAGSSYAVRSSPISTSEAGQQPLGSSQGGWGMVKQCGNSVADAQWATSCYDSECACQNLTACVLGTRGLQSLTELWGLC